MTYTVTPMGSDDDVSMSFETFESAINFAMSLQAGFEASSSHAVVELTMANGRSFIVDVDFRRAYFALSAQ